MIPSTPQNGSPHSAHAAGRALHGSVGRASPVDSSPWSRPRPNRSRPVRISQSGAGGERSEAARRALGALERVHRRSIAGLLRQASEIVARRRAPFPIPCAYPLLPMASRVWLARSREVLARARSDGWAPAGSALLELLIVRGPAGWPSSVRLARAARIVDDGEFPRLVVGYAHLFQGEAGEARRIFHELHRRSTRLRNRSRILEGLAVAQAALGHDRRALATIEAAAEDPERGVSALAQGLSLALSLGDAGRIRHAAARLDMLVDPGSPRFAAVLARLRERRDSPELREVSAGKCLLPTGPLVELARECRSPSGRVARAMI